MEFPLRAILRLIDLFPSVIDVLEFMEDECNNTTTQNQVNGILRYFESFDFVFYLQLMKQILGIMDILSQALQRKDQDMLEAVSLVKSIKLKLQDFRVNGFECILNRSFSFCGKHGIQMLSMTENYVSSRSRRQRSNITNRHYYEVEYFNTVVDMQIQEFGDRFNEASTELLANMAALNPCDSFSQFDASKLVRLSELYPYDFDSVERMTLELQLGIYYENVSTDERFVKLNGITDLAKMMVETKKHLSYPLVFRLLKLALVFPVATATVKRCFSAMKIVKTDLANRIGDDFLNDCVICAVEREVFFNVTNEDVIIRFQNMKTRRKQL